MARQKNTQRNNTAVSSATKPSSQSATKRNVHYIKNTPKIQEIEDDDLLKDDDEEEEEEEDEEEDEDDSDDSESSDSDIDDIPDPEKWRIIKESGIMGKVKAVDNRNRSTSSRSHRSHQQNVEQGDVQPDYIFEGIFFSIPTTCLFVVMDILVHRQYGETYAGADVFRKVIKVFPAILLMVYFSNKHKASKFTQAAMFAIATVCGCYFLHTMFRSPAMGIMLRAPGIITILVYCIVQLHLLPAVISLAICGLYYNFGNVKYDHRR
ncbi:hypothetical protein EDD11_010293 [Mortierella claussenii]|nr:hypothetical protein EDD11_010293 [Mortierella claussenii]